MNDPEEQPKTEGSPEPETPEGGADAEQVTDRGDTSPVDEPAGEYSALPEEIVSAIPAEERESGPVREALIELDERLAGSGEESSDSAEAGGGTESSEPDASGGDSEEVPPALRNESVAMEGRSAGELIRMGYSGRG